ncbi:MAG TPA: FAD-dependent oxidoreductase [Candidatus Saccharimonadales bacterium]|nr:FAD-dependent oxidoreductase [Candidatus Saccharimonadales bacterium]
MNERHVNNLVIGAGISGLTFANYVKDDYLILEKESEVGGYCRTIKNDRYVWDFAGHFYHFKTEEMKKLFLSLVEPEEIIEQKKITKIYYKDALVDYPFQMNINQLEKDEFVDALYDLYTKEEKETYDNFLDMLYGKFGKAIVEMFLRPYNEKLYAIDLRKLDTNAMGRFFPYADFDAIIRNFKEHNNVSYNDHFLYLKKGTQYFIDKLFDQIDKSKVELNTMVTEINQAEKYVLTDKGEKIFYKNLLNTMPLNRFLEHVDQGDNTALINEMSYNKVLVLNLGFDKPSPRYKEEHWIYFPSKELNFYRVGFYNNILGTDELNVYVEIGYPKDGVVDVDTEIEKTLDGMKKTGMIDDSMKLVDHSYVIMDPAYVHISGTTDAKIKDKIGELKEQGIYTTGRYGNWTYCSMEDCMVWAKEIAEDVNSKK